MIRKLLFFFLFIYSFQGFSQTKSEIIQQRIELISEQLESEELDLTNLLESLNYYYDNPINLNATTAEELMSLEILTDIQIADLLLHIKQFGKFISQYELQSLKYWDLQTIQNVLPFVKVDDRLDQVHISLKDALKYGRFEWFLRYQTVPESKAGYEKVADSVKLSSNNYYWGNDQRYYTRLRFAYRNNLSIGVTAEKDPGEQFFRGNQQNGFDFYSFHAFYSGGKYLKAVALGDYQVQFGQALNLWSGYAFAKTADVTNIKKNAQALKPYTSVDETRFMRGAAMQLGYKDLSMTLFGSYKKVDGSTSVDTVTNEIDFVSSIDMTGLHRTSSEINSKNQFTEIMAGANMNYTKGNFSLGVSGIQQGYDQVYSKRVYPYNQYDFRGKSTFSSSVDYAYVYKNFNFFGEVSHTSFSNGLAFLQGLIIAIDSKASLSLLYRNYGNDYQTFYNNGFGESRGTQNEQGLYVGLKNKLASAWTLNTYLDVFKSKWLNYQVDGPSSGYEFLSQLSYKPNKIMEIYGRFRQQLRQKNSRNDFAVTPLEDVIQRNYRLNFSYQILEGVQLKSRIEYVTINRLSNTPEQGMLFTQDILLKPKSKPYDIALRYALFDTDSYDSKLYSFETNALYVFSVPAYYYQGSRAYVTIRYSFLRKCDLWIRYGAFIYSNRSSLSSGTEEITGNTKSDITIQFRLSL